MIKALRIFSESGKVRPRITSMDEKELSAGDVMIRVRYSSVNFKDALAVTNKGKILKHFPLNGGIDAAGVVETSSDPRFSPGQEVIVNGCGIGESFDGGYAEKIRVAAGSIVTKPDGLSMQEAMILGTAGFTAALALHRMEQNNQTPSQGPILVTGASGGVGSVAVQLFSQAGYEVVAVSGKAESFAYLKELGAYKVVSPGKLDLGVRPLEGVRFGGAVDNVGGKMLAQTMAHTALWGNIACIGLTESAELNTTVMPMILRGVSLLGISSNNCPMQLRQAVWNSLGANRKPPLLQKILARTITLDDLPQAFDDLLERKITGRILVSI
jgi:NADPH2:quinone reductase